MFVYSYDKFRFLGNSLKDIAKYGFLINVGYNDNNLTCQKKKKKIHFMLKTISVKEKFFEINSYILLTC